jgi:hypothetical protein
MRDKARIPRIIELVGQLWDKFPDMRFTQLLMNFIVIEWQVEDDVTEASLIKAIKFYNQVEKNNAKFKSRNAKIQRMDKSKTSKECKNTSRKAK